MKHVSTFQLTPHNLSDKTAWPVWLQKAWELEWDQPGGFQPSRADEGEVYEAISCLSGKVTYLPLGSFVTPANLI